MDLREICFVRSRDMLN